jgi:hypothetical protein
LVTVKKTKALNNLKKKITSLQFAGTAGADDCAEVKRLLIAAQEAGIEQSVLDDLRENISVLCPDLILSNYFSFSSKWSSIKPFIHQAGCSGHLLECPRPTAPSGRTDKSQSTELVCRNSCSKKTVIESVAIKSGCHGYTDENKN